MAIFRRKRRKSATPYEDDGELSSAKSRELRGAPDLSGAGFSGVLNAAVEVNRKTDDDPLSRRRNRAEANPEDDNAEAQLIEEERRRAEQ
jgi:hypothetical protein